MRKVILLMAALILTAAASVAVTAQVTTKKTEKQSETTTLDRWRTALPDVEDSSDVSQPVYQIPEEKYEESEGEIQDIITGLEESLMTAVKEHNAATLNNLLANDFTPLGESVYGEKTDKKGYIQRVAKNSKLTNYDFDKITVRVYGQTAVSTVEYKQKSADANSTLNGDFIATNIWFKRGNQWQLISHHTSRLPKS